MIDYIIFSKDRATQLELLLNSINEKAPWINPTVLYISSNHNFKKGYDILKGDYTNINFIEQQSSFQSEVLSIISKFGSNFAMMCDDNYIWRQSPEYDLVISPGTTFSIRCGFNTIIQDHTKNSKQSPLNIYCENNQYLSWPINRYHPHSNYGYVFCLDGNIYNKSEIIEYMKDFCWKNTNELEGGLFKYRDNIFTMYSYDTSISVNIPLNNMSGYTVSDELLCNTTTNLNKRFLLGNRLRLVPNQKVVGCHQIMKTHWS